MANLSALKMDKDVKATGKDFEIVPEGRYHVCILEDELKPNSAKTGILLEITLQIMSGEYEGCNLTDRLNLQNPNEIAERIGQGTLKTLCLLTGSPYPVADTRIMWGKPFIARVIIDEYESNTEAGKMNQSNKIKGYSKWIEKSMNTESKPAEKATEPKTEEKSPW